VTTKRRYLLDTDEGGQGRKMKRISSLLLTIVIILCNSFALADEISFLNIPWLSDEVYVSQTLFDKGYISEKGDIYSIDSFCYIKENDNSIEKVEKNDNQSTCRSSKISEAARGKIAGYPISSIKLSYAYDGKCQLISAEINLIEANYSDILQKLEKVYGEGTEIETELGYKEVIWKGDNNTAVLLYTENDGLDFSLIYGRLDAEEILQNCLAPADPDDVSGL
jgi:hypothetical protein